MTMSFCGWTEAARIESHRIGKQVGIARKSQCRNNHRSLTRQNRSVGQSIVLGHPPMNVAHWRIHSQRLWQKINTLINSVRWCGGGITFNYLLDEAHFHNSLVAPIAIMFNENISYRLTRLILDVLMVRQQVEAENHCGAAGLES